MVHGTPAYCLPRQISFNAPISSARAALAGHCLLFRPLAEKSPQRIFALCRVAAANSAACLMLLVRMQQIGRMAEHPTAQPMREWRSWIDVGVMHRGPTPRGHNQALILQAAGLARSPHSTRGVAIRTTDTMRPSLVLHGSGMMHDSSDGVSKNVLLHHASRFRHAVAQT